MEFKRAKQIYYSPDKIDVLHNGQPVWISNLDSTNNTVEVQYLQSQDMYAKVNSLELTEAE